MGSVRVKTVEKTNNRRGPNITDFTYKIPNEQTFHSAVLVLIRKSGNEELASLLSRSKCSIITSSSYSEKRWDAYYTIVDFAFPPNRYDEVSTKIDPETKETIIRICNEVMPAKAGFDVMDVTVSISLEDILQNVDPIEDLRKMTDEIPEKVRTAIMPDDIRAKARAMSEVYLYTYCAENALRAFIEGVSIKNFGPEYLSKLKLNTEMQEKIKERKQLQEKKKWLSARGTSDIFYLDMEDLGWIIGNNWSIFKDYFPRLDWITVNISEIADCRNQVAHHSYLQEHERDVVRTDFFKIVKQISDNFK
jgi:hypothetical protein